MVTLVSAEPQRKSQASCYTLPRAPAPACLPSFPNNCPAALQQRVSLLNFRFNGPRPGCAFGLESYLPRNLLQSYPYHIKCLFKYHLSEEPPLFPTPQSTPAALAPSSGVLSTQAHLALSCTLLLRCTGQFITYCRLHWFIVYAVYFPLSAYPTRMQTLLEQGVLRFFFITDVSQNI